MRLRLRGRADRTVRHPATWLSVVCSVPIVVAALRAIAGGWMPVGDDAIVAARIRAVFSGNPPLVGMRSTSGNNSRVLDSHHPGPLEFYLDAPVSALFHYSAVGIVLAVALVNIACVVGTIVMAHRMRGLRTAIPVAAALLLSQWMLGPDVLARPLNPYAGILSVFLMLVAAWSVLDHDRQGPWVMLLAGSFAAQASLAFCPIVVVVVGLALVICSGRVWHNRNSARSWRSRAAARKRGLIATAVTVVAWLPPIVEMFVVHPNNVQLVWRFATADDQGGQATNGISAGATFVVGHLLPTGLVRISDNFTALPDGTAVGVGLLVMLVLLLAAAAGPRLPRTAATRGCWIVMAAVLAESVALSQMPADVQQAYWELPVLVITPLCYAVLVVRGAELVRPTSLQRRSERFLARAGTTRVIAAGTVVSVAAAVLASATAGDPSRETSDRSRAVVDTVLKYVHGHARPGTPVRIESAGLESFITLAPAVGFQLMRDGHPSRFLLAWSYPEDISEWDLNSKQPGAIVITLADAGSVQDAHPSSTAVLVRLPGVVAAGVRLWIDVPQDDHSRQTVEKHRADSAPTEGNS